LLDSGGIPAANMCCPERLRTLERISMYSIWLLAASLVAGGCVGVIVGALIVWLREDKSDHRPHR
jgi:hypothetical protein